MNKPVDLRVKWATEPISSPEEAVYGMLFYTEEVMEGEGWDQPPLLGAIHVSALAGTMALSLQVPKMENEFYENFEEELSQLAAASFGAEVGGDEELRRFLDHWVGEGYEGWLVCCEIWAHLIDPSTDKVVGDPIEQRIIVFVNLENEKFGVARVRGSDKAVKIEQIPMHSLVRSLSLLNAASLMAQVRHSFSDTA